MVKHTNLKSNSLTSMKPNQSTKPLYKNWLSNVPKELITFFEDLIKEMNNWEEEIFNYFSSPITNAYTESLNRLIKTMNHVGRGYSFEALRAKILFTQGYRKVKRKKKFKDC
ncbi:transposase [Paenibacillus nasutitermitis]|nr:transposase [Paenibacillus nasutitermitis]